MSLLIGLTALGAPSAATGETGTSGRKTARGRVRIATSVPIETSAPMATGSRVAAAGSKDLDATVQEMAEQIAAAPAVSVKLARTVLRHLSLPQLRTSMDDEMIFQTFVSRSDDAAGANTRTTPTGAQA